eukprot:TRINITY_DN746_c0_g1_i1.p1 TRINITY_DN746_c0_g1~~TRINITY_DN746_c0_g1_i1.p1  ORF type:complete len:461 (-),score=188.87 TRINITY_DN746_c0_g1_i1:117-1499(-)
MEQDGGLMITPFEKNIEIWKQMWRVVERSDALLQIVDARDPLFFACPDVVKYVKETGEYKKAFLLINKADMLSLKQRMIWAKYLKSEGISFLFWSALKSQQDQLDQEKGEVESDEEEKKTVQDKKMVDEEEKKKEEEREKEREKEKTPEEIQLEKDAKICTAPELFALFQKIKDYVLKTIPAEDPSAEKKGTNVAQTRKVTIGMVGYPNVGKSSTINALCGCKKVAVTATPGKTKHFQTINLSEDIILCDCPGLVYPSFVGSRADMVCKGVLPIDQMSDYVSPIVLVCQRIPVQTLYGQYGLDPNKTPSSGGVSEYDEAAPRFLRSYAASRGFKTSHGEPDMSRAARIVMKDYVRAKLFFGHPPPAITTEEYESTVISPDNLVSVAESLFEPLPATGKPSPLDPRKPRRRKENKGALEPDQFGFGIMGARKGKKKFVTVEEEVIEEKKEEKEKKPTPKVN